ncbi:MAG: hypothetical protein ACLTBU_17065 [Zhenhengia sp.]|uniref:hypothetical protein n=1 Tax=Zhenhengia sp. TaxID=2944208 RepID=UPI0039927E8B
MFYIRNMNDSSYEASVGMLAQELGYNSERQLLDELTTLPSPCYKLEVRCVTSPQSGSSNPNRIKNILGFYTYKDASAILSRLMHPENFFISNIDKGENK